MTTAPISVPPPVKPVEGLSSGAGYWLHRLAFALLTVSAVLMAVELYVVRPGTPLLLMIAAPVWFALPGVRLVWRVLGSSRDALRTAWFVGPALGLGVSTFGLLLLWVAGLKNGWAVLLAPLFTFGLAMIAKRFVSVALHLPKLDARDTAAIAAVLLIVPLVTFVPYSHVGVKRAEGDAYRAYFTADFVWGMTVTSELAKGDVPPHNPFLLTHTLQYYWLSHLLSGAVYRNLQRVGVSSGQVVLTNGLFFGAAFIGFFYWLARASGAGALVSALAVAVGFLANSYEGIERIALHLTEGMPLDFLRNVNIDAVTRWFYEGMPVDGLQRLLLYQPHHLTGYTLACAALWLVALAVDVTSISVSLGAGILLGLSFLFSTFTAIIVGPALAAVYIVRLIQQRALRQAFSAAVLGVAPVVLAVGISWALGYVDPRDGPLMRFHLNPVALRHLPMVMLLNFGPLLFAGVGGLARWRWGSREGIAPIALVLSALGFYFTADVPDMGGVWVGWRSGHLLLIAFAICGAAAIGAAWRRRGLRPVLALVMILAIVPAVPTVAIDVFNAQDVDNHDFGAGFPWTLIISPAEREAFEWIKANTPANALVQIEPYVRGAGNWAHIPAFAERRMAAGLPISMIPLKPYQEESDNVRWGIYRSVSAEEAHRVATFLGIDYLVFGRVERKAYPDALANIAGRPDLFEIVFQNDAMTLYKVR
jgi:hypothetical protein